MKIPLLDLGAEYRGIQPEIDEAIQQVLHAGHFILGPNVAALEKEVAAYLGVQHAVGVASGTDALVLALRAIGVKLGDEVIIPTYTFFATAGAVILTGGTPVLVDVCADTYCLDVRQVAAKITARTKAIIPVHLYGHPAEMSAILELAQQHGLKVIEDNAQAFGAEYGGRKTGSLGDIGCLSFFPSKNLGGYGDGGMVVTNDGEVAERLKMLRTHGWRKKYHPEVIGYNSRLDELQAAILRVKLRYVEGWNDRRVVCADHYQRRLANSNIAVPCRAPRVKHVYHLYIIRVNNRDQVQEYLKKEGIDSAVYYPQPLHHTRPFQKLEHYKGHYPIAELMSRENLAIPIHPKMTVEQLERVATVLESAVTSLKGDA
jgi:dTDP-4-amino-4,6-dideoxygalactose transaminase